MSRTRKKPKQPARASLSAEKWTAADWISESATMQGDKEQPGDKDNDAILIGAMLLCALAHGTSLGAIAKALDVAPDRIAVFHDHLRKNGVFADDGKIHASWFEEHVGTSFMMDVLVGLGLAGRAP